MGSWCLRVWLFHSRQHENVRSLFAGIPTGVPLWEVVEWVLCAGDQNRPFPKSEHRQASSRCGGGWGQEAGPSPLAVGGAGEPSVLLAPGAQSSFVGRLLPTEPPGCPVEAAVPAVGTALTLSAAVGSKKGLRETWRNSFLGAGPGASL